MHAFLRSACGLCDFPLHFCPIVVDIGSIGDGDFTNKPTNAVGNAVWQSIRLLSSMLNLPSPKLLSMLVTAGSQIENQIVDVEKKRVASSSKLRAKAAPAVDGTAGFSAAGLIQGLVVTEEMELERKLKLLRALEVKSSSRKTDDGSIWSKDEISKQGEQQSKVLSWRKVVLQSDELEDLVAAMMTKRIVKPA